MIASHENTAARRRFGAKIVSTIPFSNCSAWFSTFLVFRARVCVAPWNCIAACGARNRRWCSAPWVGRNLDLANSTRRCQFIRWKLCLRVVFDRHFKAITLPSRCRGRSINFANCGAHVRFDDWRNRWSEVGILQQANCIVFFWSSSGTLRNNGYAKPGEGTVVLRRSRRPVGFDPPTEIRARFHSQFPLACKLA